MGSGLSWLWRWELRSSGVFRGCAAKSVRTPPADRGEEAPSPAGATPQATTGEGAGADATAVDVMVGDVIAAAAMAGEEEATETLGR